jgi:sRNA-binding carbon storage regulator CsrA
MGLTISRKVGEKVILETTQGPIEIEITEIASNRIRMRFECSRDIVILRKEIIGRDKKNENNNIG